MIYKEALEYIASLAPRGWRLGLDRMQALVEKAHLVGSLGESGGPQYIHVAGTNGKGSVTAFVQSMLVESDYRTGAFFSPYVFDPRERVQLGRDYIAPDELAALTEELQPIAESFSDTEFGGITEFEFKTALAFLAYKKWKCEWVALEVGLGGRLDATNVVTPKASVIVSIGLDHTSILGDTHQAIAHEKAGVIKPGVPAIVGQVSREAMDEIQRCADEVGAPLWRLGKEVYVESGVVTTPCATYLDIQPGIPGDIQMHNVALAIAAMDAAGASRTPEGIRLGAARAAIPGRFQRKTWRDRDFLLDGAHNPDAAIVLREELERIMGQRKGRIVLLTNMVQGHDPAHFYKELAPLVSEAVVVPIDFHRAQPVQVTAEALRSCGIRTTTHETVHEGVNAAKDAAGPEDLILVTGSFYLVGEVGRTTWTGCGTTPPQSPL